METVRAVAAVGSRARLAGSICSAPAWAAALLVIALPVVAADVALPLPNVDIPPIKEKTGSFDIIDIDQAAHLMYVGDRISQGVDIFDVSTPSARYLQTVPTGPANGVSIAKNVKKVFAGTNDGSVAIIDIDPASPMRNTVIAKLNTGGRKRADEMDYDPREKKLYAANSDDGIVSVVDAVHNTIIKQFTDMGEGLEQPRYNPGGGAGDRRRLARPLDRQHPDGGGEPRPGLRRDQPRDLYARPAAEQRRADGVLAARDPEVGLRAAGVWIGSNLSGRDANAVHKVHAPGWLLRADPARRHGAGADRGACRRGLGGRRAGDGDGCRRRGAGPRGEVERNPGTHRPAVRRQFPDPAPRPGLRQAGGRKGQGLRLLLGRARPLARRARSRRGGARLLAGGIAA